MNNPEPKKGIPTWAIVLIVLGFLSTFGVAGVGILASLGIYGTSRYLIASKEAEGKSNVLVLARGIAAAASNERVDPKTGKTVTGLPPTAPPIPGSLTDLSGRKYMSVPLDWEAPRTN